MDYDTCSCRECEARRKNERWTNNMIGAKVGSVALSPTRLHLFDVYAALGVRWGDDPFPIIAALQSVGELGVAQSATTCSSQIDKELTFEQALAQLIDHYGVGDDVATRPRRR